MYLSASAGALAIFILGSYIHPPRVVPVSSNDGAPTTAPPGFVADLSLSHAATGFIQSAIEATAVQSTSSRVDGGPRVLPREILGRLKAELKAEMKDLLLEEMREIKQEARTAAAAGAAKEFAALKQKHAALITAETAARGQIAALRIAASKDKELQLKATGAADNKAERNVSDVNSTCRRGGDSARCMALMVGPMLIPTCHCQEAGLE